jgi:hypothetical protein
MTYSDPQIAAAIAGIMDRANNKAVVVRTALDMLRTNLAALAVPAGTKYLFGAGAPASAKGADGDVYDNILTGDRYSKDGGVWTFQYRAKGEPGYTPVKGKDYTDGYTPRKNVDYRDGVDGASAYQSWLHLGNVGSEAAFIASLGNAQPGNDGADGTIWHRHDYDPAPSDGNDGDFWQTAVSLTSERRFQKVVGIWRKFYDNTGAGTGTPSTLAINLAISLATVVAGKPITFNATASGGASPYLYEVVATNTGLGSSFVLGTGASGSWTPSTPGTYDIAVTVTDTLGAVKTSVTRTLTVQPATNVLPTVSAGDDLVVTLPTNSVQLIGAASDSDGTIITQRWVQKAGPSTAVMATPTLPTTTIASLVAGIYQFQFSATDNAGGTTVDDVVVTVQAQPAPTITRFSPGSGVVGSTVVLTGTSFGATQGTSTIAFGGTLASAVSNWSDTNITVIVPAGASTGTIAVTTAAGTATAAGTYTVTTAPAWPGKPVEAYCHGDSRTYCYPDHSGPWPETSQDLTNTGAGTGNFVVTNAGQVGKGSEYGLSALDTYVLSKRDTVTYWKQLVIVWFGVNDELHNPSWTAQQTIDNLQQIHQRLNAAGFATLAVTEPMSVGWSTNPAKRDAINAALNADAVSKWGAYAVAPVDQLPQIQNMDDSNVSPDKLHFTTAINVNVLAPFFTGFINRWAASVGVPTSSSGGGSGGLVKPTAPTLANVGRTITATPGNGLPSSTLRYRLKSGAVQVGSSVTLANAVSYARGDVAFYTVATGNYTQSDVSTNTVAFPAVNTNVFYNTDFTEPFAASPAEGFTSTNDYGDGRQKVTVGDRAARFNGVQYDAINQQLHTPTGPAPAGRYKVVIEITSISGGRFTLKNTVYIEGSALDESISTVGTHTFFFTTADVGEVLKLKAEDALYAVIPSMYVEAV